jgi:hypothetical protein
MSMMKGILWIMRGITGHPIANSLDRQRWVDIGKSVHWTAAAQERRTCFTIGREKPVGRRTGRSLHRDEHLLEARPAKLRIAQILELALLPEVRLWILALNWTTGCKRYQSIARQLGAIVLPLLVRLNRPQIRVRRN